jgi:hypothetical protein
VHKRRCQLDCQARAARFFLQVPFQLKKKAVLTRGGWGRPRTRGTPSARRWSAV